MKSTFSESAGRAKGFQAIWVGETDTLGLEGEKSAHICSVARSVSCVSGLFVSRRNG